MQTTLSPGAIELIGYVAAFLTTLAFVPQVARTWRSKSVSDLSLPMLASFSAGVFLWLIYGVALGSIPVILANGATLIQVFVLTGLKIRHGRP